MGEPTKLDVWNSFTGLAGGLLNGLGGIATADANGAIADVNGDAEAHTRATKDATQAQVEALLAEARVAESRADAAQADAISLNTYDLGNPAERTG